MTSLIDNMIRDSRRKLRELISIDPVDRSVANRRDRSRPFLSMTEPRDRFGREAHLGKPERKRDQSSTNARIFAKINA